MRHGVRVGVDPGDARIGVARSDPSGFLATPVSTVIRGKGDTRKVAKIVREEEAVEVVVGLPRNLHGRETPSTEKARAFAVELAQKVAPVPVRLVDERLTTVTAESMLREQGRKGQKRRAVVDQVAAVVILQHALDAERTSGQVPGELVVAAVSAPADEVLEARQAGESTSGPSTSGPNAFARPVPRPGPPAGPAPVPRPGPGMFPPRSTSVAAQDPSEGPEGPPLL